jgi:hypothetical protein
MASESGFYASSRWVWAIVRSAWSASTIATALLITVPLWYYAARPVRMVQIQLSPTFTASGHLPCAVSNTRVNAGPAFFQFDIEGLATNVRRVALSIVPDNGKSFVLQDRGLPVQNGRASGRAQLGSDDYPITQASGYTFQLVDVDTNTTLMQGLIFAHVDELAGPTPWTLALIGLLASIIQILETVRRQDPRTQEAVRLVPPPQPLPPPAGQQPGSQDPPAVH